MDCNNQSKQTCICYSRNDINMYVHKSDKNIKIKDCVGVLGIAIPKKN